jgi:hypothetical protein
LGIHFDRDCVKKYQVSSLKAGKKSTMTVIHLTGRITEDHRLEVELPDDLPAGTVMVTLTPTPDEDAPWMPDEIREFLTFEGKSGAAIAASGTFGSWAHLGIEDSVEWIQEQRRKRRERRGI